MPYASAEKKRVYQQQYSAARRKTDPAYVEDERARSRKYARSKFKWMRHIKSGGCSRCSEKDPCCIEFHHRDPAQKIASVNHLIITSSIKAAWDEIGKCEMVCSNCHKKIHEEWKRKELNYG